MWGGNVPHQTEPTSESLKVSGKSDCSGYNPQRARRFDLQLPLRYRACRETAWHQGRTTNISHTGVLLQAERLLEAGTLVEMNIVMSEENGGGAVAGLVCQGGIVRTEAPAKGEARAGLAVRIVEHRLAQLQTNRSNRT